MYYQPDTEGISQKSKKAIERILQEHSNCLCKQSFTLDICDSPLGSSFKILRRELYKTESTKEVPVSKILIDIGVNPLLHSGQPLRTLFQILGLNKKEGLKYLLRKLDQNDIDLSDGKMNTNESIEVDSFFNVKHSLCECKPIKKISKASIYAQSRNSFKTWNNALINAGIDPNNFQRKIAKREPNTYLNAIFDYFEKNPKWNASDLRETDSIAWNLRHERNQKCLKLLHDSKTKNLLPEGGWLFASWVQFKANGRKEDPIEFFLREKNTLINEYETTHRLQKVWDEEKVIREIQSIFSENRRITRGALEKSENLSDKTLLASSRRLSERKDHNEMLSKAGFLPSVLNDIYLEEDEKWNRLSLFRYAQKLIKIYLDTGNFSLSRGWCQTHAKEFHDALLRLAPSQSSWEESLKWIGLDADFFAMSATERTKRGFLFQNFVRKLFLLNGFYEVLDQNKLSEDNIFIYNKFYGCHHEVKCKPDFLFKDFIVDTKTGIGAIIPNEEDGKLTQIERYLEHRKLVYLVTLNQNLDERVIRDGVVKIISFKTLLQLSKKLFGIQLPIEASKDLTKVIKTKLK